MPLNHVFRVTRIDRIRDSEECARNLQPLEEMQYSNNEI